MGCCSYFYLERSGSKAARSQKFLIFVLQNDCTFEFNCSQLKMPRKRKASLNGNGTREQKLGRKPKEFTLDDVIELVRFSLRTAPLKINIVMTNLQIDMLSFCVSENYLLRLLCTD